MNNYPPDLIAEVPLFLHEAQNHATLVDRTLYFHTGTHKTGSTALQAYLSANRIALGKSGVSYEHPAGTYHSMGNGQHLYEQLYNHSINESQLEGLLEFYFAGRQLAICSTEDFTLLQPNHWHIIKNVCQQLQIQVKFVTFVRNIIPYYHSLMGQLIKSGEIFLTFDEFTNINQYFPVLESLRCLHALFGRESMTIIHYESAFNSLDSKFMSAIGLNPKHFDRSQLEKTINRSLTEYEQKILSDLNKTIGRQYSYELSVFLMNQKPHLKSEVQISEEIIAKLSARHAADLVWLNQTFFDSQDIVKITNSAEDSSKKVALGKDDRKAIDHDVIKWCISKFKTVQDDSIKYVAGRLHAIDWSNANHSLIPEDFDPLAYLLLNVDVLMAGVPPYEHFILSGHYENRMWKWTNQYHDAVPAKSAPQDARCFPLTEADRVSMTVGCGDCAKVPKVPDAGCSFIESGLSLQMMHDGTRVLAGGYYGEWMQTVIQRLNGHHEPQEELLFHTLLTHIRPHSLIVEFGSYWAYYSNWYMGAVAQSTAICIEPDENRMQVGVQNFKLNQRQAAFHLAAAGGRYQAEHAFVRESDGATVTLPVWDFEKLLEQVGSSHIELLHMDAQGAELPFLQSIARAPYQGRLRFVVVSTHHASISGSATTHRDCLATLINLGAFILCEHSVEESYSGDGLIVASFHAEDADLVLPQISRNNPENSLFGPDPKREVKTAGNGLDHLQAATPLHVPAEQVELVQTADGPMHILVSDSVIGATIKAGGTFQTEKIDEVLAFLKANYAIAPNTFVDVGANIGTHLVHALKACGIAQGLAFEPDPNNHALLLQNLMANDLQDRVRAFKLALSSRSGAATFELCGSNFGDHRVRVEGTQPVADLGESQRQLISVLTDTGAQLFAEHALTLTSKTLMWVDTQGHEGHVLKGFGGLVATQDKPFVVCEFWPYGLERAGGRDLLFDFLDSCVVIYDINQPDWQHNPLAGTLPLQKMYKTMLLETRLGHYPHTDLLCVLI